MDAGSWRWGEFGFLLEVLIPDSVSASYEDFHSGGIHSRSPSGVLVDVVEAGEKIIQGGSRATTPSGGTTTTVLQGFHFGFTLVC